ncbi:hypothetical protein BD413DRAFT_197723 [Trametes elegans]|nr:hypothetical protein BD413DRAFT_197723 [Trametes elegans]
MFLAAQLRDVKSCCQHPRRSVKRILFGNASLMKTLQHAHASRELSLPVVPLPDSFPASGISNHSGPSAARALPAHFGNRDFCHLKFTNYEKMHVRPLHAHQGKVANLPLDANDNRRQSGRTFCFRVPCHLEMAALVCVMNESGSIKVISTPSNRRQSRIVTSQRDSDGGPTVLVRYSRSRDW